MEGISPTRPSPDSGLVFDIEEFAAYDGPGLRTAVFFKGCPLRCRWCHNPEGLSPSQEILRSQNGCTGCGACKAACPSPDCCILCLGCVDACPRNLIRVAGRWWRPDRLAARLKKHADIFEETGGGVTLTGGEVLMQPDFLLALLEGLEGVHRAVETSGFGPPEVFSRMLGRCELVMLDLKQMDSELHRAYTGLPNGLILQNLKALQASGVPYIIRIPLIPGVNDNEAHFQAVGGALARPGALLYVELLPYNQMAGAKYASVGRTYDDAFLSGSIPNRQAADILSINNIEVRYHE